MSGMPRVGSCRFVPGACLRFCGSCRSCQNSSACHAVRVTRVGKLSACHVCRDPCVSLCFCVSLRVIRVTCHACRVSCVSTLLHVMRVACHACLDRLRFGSCPCHGLACLRFVFVFVRRCNVSVVHWFRLGQTRVRFCALVMVWCPRPLS
jgi:hypothetical protein